MIYFIIINALHAKIDKFKFQVSVRYLKFEEVEGDGNEY